LWWFETFVGWINRAFEKLGPKLVKPIPDKTKITEGIITRHFVIAQEWVMVKELILHRHVFGRETGGEIFQRKKPKHERSLPSVERVAALQFDNGMDAGGVNAQTTFEFEDTSWTNNRLVRSKIRKTGEITMRRTCKHNGVRTLFSLEVPSMQSYLNE
jgi:hypothetical protein